MKINGCELTIVRQFPRMQLSEKVSVTQEFRDEINAWMIDFFGFHSLVEPGQVILDYINKRAYVNEVDYNAAAFKALLMEFKGSL